MCHMVRGWGGVPWKAVVATALTLIGVLAFSVPALGAGDPPPVPKPDPPPKVAPPPPPPVPATPPAGDPACRPGAGGHAVRHPSDGGRDPRRGRAPSEAEGSPLPARRPHRGKEGEPPIAAAGSRSRILSSPVAAANDTPSSSWGLPFILIAFSTALALLGLALMPARAVPWSRASRVLDDRRDEFGVIGAMGLVATVVFFLLVQVTK